jgi:cytochrome c biogenesis protein CcmG/thiol:disulfide interchange protein DsbE
MSSIGANCRNLAAALAVVTVAAAGAGCMGDDESDTADPGSADPESVITLEEAQVPPKKAPPELVALREQANEILDEDLDAFEARLAEFEAAGIPVVINKWASWCGPCREEFPDFQEQAIERGGEIAFVGLLADDGPETGATFLEGLPVPYPSYLDPDQEIADSLEIDREFPTTLIIGSDGETAYAKYGPYTSAEQLSADIEEYAQ